MSISESELSLSESEAGDGTAGAAGAVSTGAVHAVSTGVVHASGAVSAVSTAVHAIRGAAVAASAAFCWPPLIALAHGVEPGVWLTEEQFAETIFGLFN